MAAFLAYFIKWEKTTLLLGLLLFTTQIILAQTTDTLKAIDHFSGKISVTHNGISLIPSFSLDRPAAIFNLTMAKKRLSFEPELRFALEGKPWSFLFWWRYKAIKKDKFSLRLGAHPALNFRDITIGTNGDARKIIQSRRYLATEIAPNYAISKKVSVGTYYLYSHGFDEGLKNAHFVVLNSGFSNLKLSDKLDLSVFPQIYYLKIDTQDGFYFASTLNLVKKDFPLSLSSIINKSIETNIVPDKNLVWNISLVYAFE